MNLTWRTNYETVKEIDAELKIPLSHWTHIERGIPSSDPKYEQSKRILRARRTLELAVNVNTSTYPDEPAT